MSSSVEFKKLQEFWRSQEENNRVPDGSCEYFRRMKLINESPNQLKLQTNVAKAFDPVEEKKSNAIPNEEFYPEWLSNQSTVRELKRELPFEKALTNPAIIITDVDSSPSQTSESQIQSIEEKPESIVLGSKQDNLSNPVADENSEQDCSDDECVLRELRSEHKYKDKLLSPDSINNDSESITSVAISIDDNDSISSINEPYYSKSSAQLSSSSETTNIKYTSEDNFFDDDWCFQKNHIFVLSFAGKPIFSLQRHGSENKMSDFFGVIQCLISNFESRRDRILSIDIDGIKIVFFVRKTLYFVAASRDNMVEHHLRLQLREVYNRMGFLLTFASMNSILEKIPSYDLRQQLSGNYDLISNQLTTKITVSNNIFTLFTNSIRVLPLHPTSRATITNIIKTKCSKISNLAFAVLIVNDQLVALVRLTKHTLHSSDIRLIFNLMQCSEKLFSNFHLWMLPICLPNFKEDRYLHAYISSISDECDAFLILLANDCTMTEELSKAHREITKTLHGHNWFRTICQEINNSSQEGNGFNIGVINIPELLHFLYLPKSSNNQLLSSKIIPPYTCLSEFKRLETIYRDLHSRIHNKNRPLKLIFEVKEKEVALALQTGTAEIYAVFDPLVNTISVANHYIETLVRWINREKEAYFIRRYPKF